MSRVKTSNMKFSLGTRSGARPCSDTSDQGNEGTAQEDEDAGMHSLDCLLKQGLGKEARQPQHESKCKM